MPRKTRIVVVGLLLLALASTTAQALPSAPRLPVETGSILSAVWERLASLLDLRPEAPARSSSAPTKEGSQLDPNGATGPH